MTITGSGTLFFSYDGNTIEISPHVAEMIDYEQNAEEYVKYDNQELIDLYKKGNRKVWQYNIWQGTYTDAEFDTLRLEFEAMNGHLIVFDPHYDSSKTYTCYLEFYFDDCTRFPAKFMNINVISKDYTDQEA